MGGRSSAAAFEMLAWSVDQQQLARLHGRSVELSAVYCVAVRRLAYSPAYVNRLATGGQWGRSFVRHLVLSLFRCVVGAVCVAALAAGAAFSEIIPVPVPAVFAVKIPVPVPAEKNPTGTPLA